ncbi:hypothetical protein ACRAWG_03490 [Methylobacterium sp. P31]
MAPGAAAPQAPRAGDRIGEAMGSVGGRPRIGRGLGARLLRAALPVLALTMLMAAVDPALAARLIGAKGSETGSGAGGYGRIVLTFDKPVPVKAKLAGGVLILGYGERIAPGPERLAEEMPAFVSSVRRDPDGTSLRVALQRPYRINLQSAGERVFIDLLPEGWSGLPPPLPPEVVAELARRARVAEEALKARMPEPVRKPLSLEARAAADPDPPVAAPARGGRHGGDGRGASDPPARGRPLDHRSGRDPWPATPWHCQARDRDRRDLGKPSHHPGGGLHDRHRAGGRGLFPGRGSPEATRARQNCRRGAGSRSRTGRHEAACARSHASASGRGAGRTGSSGRSPATAFGRRRPRLPIPDLAAGRPVRARRHRHSGLRGCRARDRAAGQPGSHTPGGADDDRAAHGPPLRGAAGQIGRSQCCLNRERGGLGAVGR